MNGHAALWCKSNYSFLEGASHPEELVDEAHRHGLAALALTDQGGVYGVVRAHVRARELGLRLILGAQMTLVDGTNLVLLAMDRGGWANLCELISTGRLRSAKGECSVAASEVCERQGGLIALWGGDKSSLAGEGDPERVALELREAFGDRLYALLARHRRAEERRAELRLRERATRFGLPLVAATEVLYHCAARRLVQDTLTCIRHGVAIARAFKLLKPNGEHDLKTRHAFVELYADEPAAVARTEEVAARCNFALDQIRYRYPAERLPDGTSASEHLRNLVDRGARGRYPDGVPAAVRAQLDKELALIEELDYGGYFLTMHEIVEYCRAQSILCQGRGSAANSAVCFCLGVTAVDPVRMQLLFERFLSKERAEPPDIDLDIEHERREEVIQHVYATYGRAHAAMVANVIRYRARSAVRDVGKVLGFAESLLTRVARQLSYSDALDEKLLAKLGLSLTAPATRRLCELSAEIEDFPRHLSIHPGGFLLGHERVSTLVPIENATMEARTVIQWDKDDVEAIGLFKVDLLGLGALTHLHGCLRLLEKHSGIALSSLADIPADDAPTYDMLCAADTVGVFQVESRAQMSMLPRLEPRNYYDIVIQVSIVRPGPITGGMVHPFLRRRRKEEEVVYPHECLREVLEKTLGVPLFQEQVMKLAMVAADYTPGEADQLRRDMAAWRRGGRIAQHRERIVSRMLKKGIAGDFAERVFEQIKGFGEYGFPESHAASFALLSYAGAWFKRHHPAVFTCALLNALPMGFYSRATLVDDVRRHGIEVRPVCAAASEWDSTLEGEWNSTLERAGEALAIRMGLSTVNSLREGDGARIVKQRTAAAFASIEDFKRRCALDERALKALAEAGAFEQLAGERRGALWQTLAIARVHAPTLFALDEPPVGFAALSAAQEIAWDYERTRHSARGHPLAPLRAELSAQRLPDSAALRAMKHGARAHYAGIVICRQHPATASGVTFMTLEDEFGFVNVVLWRDVFEKYALLAKSESFLGVSGRIQAEEGVVHLVASRLWTPQVKALVPAIDSHDFH